jgi:DNA-binding NarL/FixJ family response regulator
MGHIYKKQPRELPFRRSQLRLILADDQTILRRGLRAILDAESDLQVVGEASDVHEATALSRRLLPDVVITDVPSPDGVGFQAISQLRRECAGVRVLLLSGHSCPGCIRAAMTAGAHAYILKSSPFDVLLRAIRSEVGEYDHLSLPLHTFASGRRPAELSASAKSLEMTARERQVLIGVALGYSNKQIAGDLGRSIKTIEKHRFNMMHRLGLPNAAAATRYAMDNGLLEAASSPGRIPRARRGRRTDD